MASTRPLPSVSVVIPAYNESSFIGQCLDSLQHQDLEPLEIIMVDNNSTDDTVAIAKQYPKVKVISESQQGIVFARNAGFDAASGAIIARCDADSVLPRTWVKHIATAFAGNPQLAAITGPATFYDLPKQLAQMKQTLKRLHVLFYFKGSKTLLGHEVLFGSNMALTKAVWDQVKAEACTDESKMHEDTDLAIHIDQAGGLIKFDSGLHAGISMRRAKSSLPDLIDYLGRWTGTRSLHPPIKKTRS